ncbi:MAG: hypothetical protein JST82_06145 [Bacteroidetes bacterium]|nr:hypothetical protein [Bacteroidota bacterium]
MNEHYEGFAYAAKELSAYIYGAGIFVISLTDQKVIHYEPSDAIAFKDWLTRNNIRNVEDEIPKHIYNALINKSNN